VNAAKQTDIRREWLTYEEARRLVGLSRTSLWKLVNSGSVTGARVGRSVRINRTSLEAYMERQVTGATSTNGDNDLHTEGR
jgi:excisionase family DNA binding protein